MSNTSIQWKTKK